MDEMKKEIARMKEDHTQQIAQINKMHTEQINAIIKNTLNSSDDQIF